MSNGVDNRMKARPIATEYQFVDEFGHLLETDKVKGVKIEWRGAGLWAVTVGMSCLNNDGNFEFEPPPAKRDNEFLQRCRFSLHDAFIMAARKAGIELIDDDQ